ncbi:UvrD/REP helicase N-terminal domain-containing protein [Cnuella takakiae]|uniref:DNA 3'-5' helicase n=1 Tax=Cnuella takakiae TaxID=1302690 RepID=A0A1M4TEQ4_9BACT|nr:UvrD-helicase domain-containing protein [Cnuella takakiae]OLY94594.1 hypothetical protein BUE76_01535 [Cnuella takakiae]SHE42970.1 UvrD/REP helicase N-terminal domain-containing protein [Cnuella takakiae]
MEQAVLSSSKLLLTPEQNAILSANGNIQINAVAGSGKTTTLIHYAATRPVGSRILYLAFNRSVRMEAHQKFAAHGLTGVQVETAHSLAFKAVVAGGKYKVRECGYTVAEIAGLLSLSSHGQQHGAMVLANHINRYFSYFCNSKADTVESLHYADTVKDAQAQAFVQNLFPYILGGTRRLWQLMEEGRIAVTHDFYLKKYQLSKPLLSSYGYILFDEAQDASAAMLDVFLRQRATKVMVGDRHQQIYSWRYAVNALDLPGFTPYHLTVSFRFPPAIAKLARWVLVWKNMVQPCAPVTIEGRGMAVAPVCKATLARTNLGLLLRAIRYIREHPEVARLYFEGNINSYTYASEGASLYDVLHLYNGRLRAIRNPLLRTMRTLTDLEAYIRQTEDVELGMMVKLVQEYGNEIVDLIAELKRKQVADGERRNAVMVFSTVHRCKGLEYDAVQLAEDFITEAGVAKAVVSGEPSIRINEEINLLYVALTRTRGLLRIPEKLLPRHFPALPNIVVLPNSQLAEPKPLLDLEKPHTPTKNKPFAEIRKQFPNAYEPWTPMLDSELKRLYTQGKKIGEIARHFGRQPGAIGSRLKKLGISG